MATYLHDPDADLDYGWDWKAGSKPFLIDIAEVIVTSSWSISPTGPTLHDDGHDDTTTTVWVAGGSVGTTYQLTNHVVSSAGREDDRSHRLQCQER